MYYEIYVDSLFLVNFVMNLYLLLIVNKGVNCAATQVRLVLGAAVGAVAYFVPLVCGGAVWMKIAAGMVAGNFLMIFIAFPIHSAKAFLQITERLVLSSFLMGGGILFLLQRVPFVRQYMHGIFGVMGLGALIYLAVSWFQERKRGKCDECKVTLYGRDGKMKVTALIDSGNSLIEPISGKPVSIVDRNVFGGLWNEPPEFYRVIPYHSIGKKRGILKGYLLSEIQIEVDGVAKNYRDVYVAVSEENITCQESHVKMIVNPVLLKC